MKFLKISEKALRCVLKMDELKEQNIRLEDMMLGTANAQEFLNKIIIQACLELDMELESQKLSVHVMPLPGERLDLVISEFEDGTAPHQAPVEDKVSMFPSALQEPPSPMEESRTVHKKLLFAAYRFPSLTPIEQFSRRIAENYIQKSSLFQEPISGAYYLCLYEKRRKFRVLTDIAAEYGTLCSMDPSTELSLKEHCETILKKHAVTYLAEL